MVKSIKIKNINYTINDDELKELIKPELSPLIFHENLGNLEKEISLFKLFSIFLKENNKNLNLLNFGQSNGGYILLNLLENFEIYTNEMSENFYTNLYSNFNKFSNKVKTNSKTNDISIIRLEDYKVETLEINYNPQIIFSYNQIYINNYKELFWLNQNKYIYINQSIYNSFYSFFNIYIKDNYFVYNNLLKLLIMVKNASDNFRNILNHNKNFIDRWCILDTGSTDNTIQIINETLLNIPGRLYQEPFINFKESRNRLIELSNEYDKEYGECLFNIMLDDTYIINGDLCNFLEILKDDIFADSFSIFIEDEEYKYSSNRILKPWKNLKYNFPVHEIIQSENNTNNCCIPYEKGNIIDIRTDYMNKRTLNRKNQDLEILLNELKKEPDNSRNYYYTAETYLSLENYQKAYFYYEKRSKMDGFNEEIYDSLYKMAVLGIYNLNFDHETNLNNIKKCYEYNKDFPDSICLFGLYYYDIDKKKSFEYFKQILNNPIKLKTMNNRYILYNYYSILLLLQLSDYFENYEISLRCITKLIKENKEKIEKENINLDYFYKNALLFQKYFKLNSNSLNQITNDNLIYFLIDGGWENWNGKSYEKGIGGSETFVIKYSETLSKNYKVFVFCKTENYTLHNNVLYIPIDKYVEYCIKLKPKVCFINRFPEFINITNKCNIDCYLICHDLFRQNEIIPKCKGILTISDWHTLYVKNFIKNSIPVHEISYGIEENDNKINKIKNSFIYSSFPNRGLYYLLKMFPKILNNFPDSTLNIFCDFKNSYVLRHYEKEIKEIIEMIEDINKKYDNKVINHGWVNKNTLRNYWLSSEYWLYPCIFTETCCHTAMESAISKTLVITNNLGALKDTVGDRGIIINGDPREEGWQYLALNRVLNIMKGLENKENYLKRNYEWAKNKSYEIVVKDFENRFIKI